MPVVRSRHAYKIRIGSQQLTRRVGFSETFKIGERFPVILTKGLGPGSGPGGDRRQIPGANSKGAIVNSVAGCLQHRSIGFVEDHPHADHSGLELM